ncbi:hypothetical protein [Imhoffiella purpurea]|uniref:Uncharacterized protein n=1 Tax=Imhoffiella purpurea TaxID=1249627 RepID=W9VJ46_9GAMM|nr:hypothetical protein [Imhoffiella purpurea]EXJ17021.1 hypothetical protein D779_1844 [Imhoffiella purpurea]
MDHQSKTYTDDQGQPLPDQRTSLQVRQVFDEAWKLLEPMLDKQGVKEPASGFMLVQELRNEFPQLSAADRHLLISTIMRMYVSRR